LWANTDADANVKPDGNVYTYSNTNSYRYGYIDAYTYSAVYGYTNGKPKLHTELCIHIGDRNTRAGSHRHWQPLR
jgi:hypothetical protein